ncbi:UNVERIFIED_CONTAM: hypothetical protein NCL1_23720 [Trichonephila clavipes]
MHYTLAHEDRKGSPLGIFVNGEWMNLPMGAICIVCPSVDCPYNLSLGTGETSKEIAVKTMRYNGSLDIRESDQFIQSFLFWIGLELMVYGFKLFDEKCNETKIKS